MMIIENWMLNAVRTGSIDRYDDLHIDEIDTKWKAKTSWLSGGLEAFKNAIFIRNQHNLPVNIVLAFSLEASDDSVGADFKTPEEFLQSLNWMPPSLYVFRPGEEFWHVKNMATANVASPSIVVSELARDLLGNIEQVKHCYYMEFKNTDSDEYTRSVFVEG